MPVFNQDPKINANANIITANSKEELPDPSTVKPNTVALIPSVAQSVYVYDSLDAAAAANLPEGSLVAVPSEGSGGGLPVVELTTTIATNAQFTDTESELLEAAYQKGMPIIIKGVLKFSDTSIMNGFAGVAMKADMNNNNYNMPMFAVSFGSTMINIIKYEGIWTVAFEQT